MKNCPIPPLSPRKLFHTTLASLCLAAGPSHAALLADIPQLDDVMSARMAAQAIVDSISEPVISGRTIDLADYAGHDPDAEGTHEFRADIQRAIDELHAEGGGTLLFSHTWEIDNWRKYPETYRIRGPILLKSNVQILIEPSVVLFFEFDPESYLVDGKGVAKRYEGSMVITWSGLIRAVNARNIAIRGRDGAGAPPEIRGDGFAWRKWSWDGQQRFRAEGRRQFYDVIRDDNHADKPVRERVYINPEEDFFRPVVMEFYFCDTVLVEGVRITESPFWTIQPVFSQNLIFRNLQFNCYGSNSDGIDPDSSRNILVENVIFGNDDDNIAVKAGRDRDGREGADIRGTEFESIASPYIVGGRVLGPTENIVVRNSMFQGHHAVAIGSEMSGGVDGVYILDNRSVQSVNTAIYVKGSRKRGGTVSNVHIHDLKLTEVRKDCISMIPNYDGDTESPWPPVFRNITISGVTADSAEQGIRLHGWADAPIENVTIRDVSIGKVMGESLEIVNGRNISLENVEIGGAYFEGEYTREDANAIVPVKQ